MSQLVEIISRDGQVRYWHHDVNEPINVDKADAVWLKQPHARIRVVLEGAEAWEWVYGHSASRSQT